MQSPKDTAATTKISMKTAAATEDEMMAVEFEGCWRWGEGKGEAGVRVLIKLVDPASVPGSTVKNKLITLLIKEYLSKVL